MDLDAEMVRYYAARAGEYDDWYLRRGRYQRGTPDDQAWVADLEAAAVWLTALPMTGDIAELAAGTGWWSPILARKGNLSLYDATPEPLEIAAERLRDLALSARFEVRDAWAEPDRAVDALFAGFWLSHVGRDRLDEFLALAGRWLRPGGMFAFIDSRPDSKSSAVNHAPPIDDVQVRRLDDGSAYRVRKVFYEPAELADALGKAGFDDVSVDQTSRFFLLGSARR